MAATTRLRATPPRLREILDRTSSSRVSERERAGSEAPGSRFSSHCSPSLSPSVPLRDPLTFLANARHVAVYTAHLLTSLGQTFENIYSETPLSLTPFCDWGSGPTRFSNLFSREALSVWSFVPGSQIQNPSLRVSLYPESLSFSCSCVRQVAGCTEPGL